MFAAMATDNTPSSDKAADWAAYYSQHGNQVRGVLEAYLWVFAGLALIGFLLVLRDRMDGRMPMFSVVTGSLAAGGMCIGGALFGAVGGTLLFGNASTPSGETAEFTTSTAFPVILLASMIPLAASLFGVGVVTVRTHALPVWIGWFAVVAGVLLLASVVWLPMFAAVLFGLVVGIALTVRTTAPAAPPEITLPAAA